VEACEWFPLATGARWAYRVKGDGAETRAVVRVLERIEAEPAGVYRVEYEVGSGIKTTRLVAPAGDRYVSRGEGTAAPGEWRQEAVFGPKADAPLTDGLFRYAGVERVTVPAGEFEAAKVERLGPDGMAESVSWYVRDVGLVKRLTLSTGAVQELTGYTIPETKR
jgi:hypothetical protein